MEAYLLLNILEVLSTYLNVCLQKCTAMIHQHVQMEWYSYWKQTILSLTMYFLQCKQLFTNLKYICKTHPNKETICPQVYMLHYLFCTHAAGKHFRFWPFFQIGNENFDYASAVGPGWILPCQCLWCCLLGC